jgi:hypothetical protein
MVKIMVDMLTDTGVSIKTQQYVEQDGVEYTAGLPHRCAYVNSHRGRADIAAALDEPYLSAVMAVWGDTAIVPEVEGL